MTHEGSVSHKMAAVNKAERGGVRERGMGVWRAAVRAAFPTRVQRVREKIRLETLTATRAVGKPRGDGEAQAP